jgi:hypothetical protein
MASRFSPEAVAGQPRRDGRNHRDTQNVCLVVWLQEITFRCAAFGDRSVRAGAGVLAGVRFLIEHDLE